MVMVFVPATRVRALLAELEGTATPLTLIVALDCAAVGLIDIEVVALGTLAE